MLPNELREAMALGENRGAAKRVQRKADIAQIMEAQVDSRIPAKSPAAQSPRLEGIPSEIAGFDWLLLISGNLGLFPSELLGHKYQTEAPNAHRPNSHPCG